MEVKMSQDKTELLQMAQEELCMTCNRAWPYIGKSNDIPYLSCSAVSADQGSRPLTPRDVLKEDGTSEHHHPAGERDIQTLQYEIHGIERPEPPKTAAEKAKSLSSSFKQLFPRRLFGLGA